MIHFLANERQSAKYNPPGLSLERARCEIQLYTAGALFLLVLVLPSAFNSWLLLIPQHTPHFFHHSPSVRSCVARDYHKTRDTLRTYARQPQKSKKGDGSAWRPRAAHCVLRTTYYKPPYLVQQFTQQLQEHQFTAVLLVSLEKQCLVYSYERYCCY